MSTSINDIIIDFSQLTDGQALVWDADNQKFVGKSIVETEKQYGNPSWIKAISSKKVVGLSSDVDSIISSRLSSLELGNGSLSSTGLVPISRGGTGANSAAGARATLGLRIGVDVQPYSQYTSFHHTVETTDDTITTLYAYPVESNASIMVKAHIVAKESGSDVNAVWSMTAHAYNSSGVVILGGSQVEFANATPDASLWDVNFIVDDDNIVIKVTGEVGSTICWDLTRFDIFELTFA